MDTDMVEHGSGTGCRGMAGALVMVIMVVMVVVFVVVVVAVVTVVDEFAGRAQKRPSRTREPPPSAGEVALPRRILAEPNHSVLAQTRKWLDTNYSKR